VHCSISDAYLLKAKSDTGLAELEKEAIDDVQTSFNFHATYGIPTSELFNVRYNISNQDELALFLKNPRTGGGRFLDAPKRVFIVQHHEWLANQRLTVSPNNRGRYLYVPAIILLHENGDNKNSWCKKTLVHESLHSISLYSRIWNKFPDILSRHQTLIEGITECLTGYVLFKRHPSCYNGWKTNQLDRCSISYKEMVRLWCSFCQVVGIGDLAKFYLSSKDNFSDPWSEFVQSINSLGFKKFNYPLNELTAFREPQFREVCIKTLPGFKEIYDTQTKCFDFSKIP
jgi:hypothetical protein